MADQNTSTVSCDQKQTADDVPEPDKYDERVFGPDDPELDDLLDSALEDFDLSSNTTNIEKATEKSSNVSTEAKEDTGGAAPNPAQDAMFNEVFSQAMSDQAQTEFENVMKRLMEGDPDFMSTFSQMAQASGGASSGNMKPPPSKGHEEKKPLSETLQEAVGSMAQNAEELQNDNLSEEELAQMMAGMGNLNFGGEGEDDLSFMPMMQGMMKSLLSKEVLYPSLKEISSKYPSWLEENKGKIDSPEYDNYERQFKLMTSIINEFEAEKDNDSDELKKKRFDKILDYMQEMQELGHPPKEIVGDLPPGVEMDENGMPQFPGGIPGMGGMPGMNPNQQCCLM